MNSKQKQILMYMLLLSTLSGCADLATTLTNRDGKQYHCQATGAGLIGTAIATSRYNDCVAAANSRGYN